MSASRKTPMHGPKSSLSTNLNTKQANPGVSVCFKVSTITEGQYIDSNIIIMICIS